MPKFADYRVRALIALVRATGEQQTLEGLHHAIESDIAKRIKAINDGHASGNKDFADAITDDECDQIEELLGLSFVECKYTQELPKVFDSSQQGTGQPVPGLFIPDQ